MKSLSPSCRVFDEVFGSIKISDLKIGNNILGCVEGVDSYVEVIDIIKHEINSSYNVTFSNGTFVNINDISFSSWISPKYNKIIDNGYSPIGWVIGSHLGDGCCDRKLVENINESYYKYRIRFNGDNENVVKEYSNVINSLTNSNNTYSKIKRYSKNVDVWEYTISNKNVKNTVDFYLDGQFGNKTHIGFIPKYVKENNLWQSFIAGLIDSDGFIKSNGSVDILVCMGEVINDICVFLSAYGVEYKYTYKITKRENESNLHRLVIYFRNEIVKILANHMKHEDKINKISSSSSKKKFKIGSYSVDDEIINRMLNAKLSINDSRYNNMCGIKSLIRKNGNNIGLGSLSLFHEIGVVTDNEYYEIISKNNISTIVNNKVDETYYEIKTKSGNYYAGEFGLVLIS